MIKLITVIKGTVQYLQENCAGVLMLYHALDLLVEGLIATISGDPHIVALPSLIDVAQTHHAGLLGELPPGCADAWESFWGWLTGNGCTAH